MRQRGSHVGQLGELARTHTCGDCCGASDIGREVLLLGWVHRCATSGTVFRHARPAQA
jgi:hypothetical protein